MHCVAFVVHEYRNTLVQREYMSEDKVPTKVTEIPPMAVLFHRRRLELERLKSLPQDQLLPIEARVMEVLSLFDDDDTKTSSASFPEELFESHDFAHCSTSVENGFKALSMCTYGTPDRWQELKGRLVDCLAAAPLEDRQVYLSCLFPNDGSRHLFLDTAAWSHFVRSYYNFMLVPLDEVLLYCLHRYLYTLTRLVLYRTGLSCVVLGSPTLPTAMFIARDHSQFMPLYPKTKMMVVQEAKKVKEGKKQLSSIDTKNNRVPLLTPLPVTIVDEQKQSKSGKRRVRHEKMRLQEAVRLGTLYQTYHDDDDDVDGDMVEVIHMPEVTCVVSVKHEALQFAVHILDGDLQWAERIQHMLIGLSLSL